MTQGDPICCICLETTDTFIHVCNEIPTKMTCKDCLLQYIEQKLSSAFPGTCPALTCPCHSKRLMEFQKLIEILPYDHIQRYSQLANTLLIFLCGACHNSKSMAIEYNPANVQEAEMKVFDKILEVAKAKEIDFEAHKIQFLGHFNEYCSGIITVESFFDICRDYFHELCNGTESDAMQTLSNLLRLIQNPERRNLLHLRFLNERPRFYTPCCSRLHCFRCKTKDFHDDKTCEENTLTLDSSIIACPNCNIHLAKADGCNSVSCVCGVQFSWSNELDVSSFFVYLVLLNFLT